MGTNPGWRSPALAQWQSLLPRGSQELCRPPRIYAASVALLGKEADRDPEQITVRINLPVKGLETVEPEKSFGDVTSFTDEFKSRGGGSVTSSRSPNSCLRPKPWCPQLLKAAALTRKPPIFCTLSWVNQKACSGPTRLQSNSIGDNPGVMCMRVDFTSPCSSPAPGPGASVFSVWLTPLRPVC